MIVTYVDMLEAISEVLREANLGIIDEQEGGVANISWQLDNPVCYWTVKFVSDEIIKSTLTHDQVRYDWSIKGFFPINYDCNSEKFFLSKMQEVKDTLRISLPCLQQSAPKVILNDYIEFGDGEGLVRCHFCDIRYSTTLLMEREREVQ